MGGKKLVGLIRVSTDRQGESGLGLEAQEAAIAAYAARTGATLLKVYREVESGGHDDLADRPELLKALAHARRTGATLVIAKLDRLLRSTVAHSALKVAKVPFVALDNESANELTLRSPPTNAARSANGRRPLSVPSKPVVSRSGHPGPNPAIWTMHRVPRGSRPLRSPTRPVPTWPMPTSCPW